MSEQDSDLLEQFWKDFKDTAFPNIEDEVSLATERGVFFGGVVCAVSYLTREKSADNVLKRLGNLINSLEHNAEIEMENLRTEKDESGAPICYDGSNPL